MKRNVYLKLTPLAAARKIWLDGFGAVAESPLRVEEVSLCQAEGRTLAEPATALLSSPAFHGAAMDGIAIAAESSYGATESRPKQLCIDKDAWWINTGHPLPPGTNAVVMVENVILLPQAPGSTAKVHLEKAVFPWQHVRKMGEDMVATEILLPPGTVLGAYELGALAAAGVIRPKVYVRPLVHIIPTGSELVSLEEASPELLSSGLKLPEFNSIVLSALVRAAGGEAFINPIVPDEPQALREAIAAAVESRADLVVINAGSSAGTYDYSAGLIAELGEVWVHGVNIMPGKPTILGRIKNKPVMGVPGYPVSAIISFEEFGQSLLALWQNRQIPEKSQAMSIPYQALPSKPGIEEFVRVKLGQVEDKLIAIPLQRGAGTVTSLSRADGIIRIPADCEGLPQGEPAPTVLIRTKEQISGAILAIGSHDNSLDLLDSFMRKNNPHYSLTSAHVGSLGGIMALKEQRCHLAGSHLLDFSTGIYNQAAIGQHLTNISVRLVRLVDREQGLILQPGNPLGIKTISDLGNPGVNFINRQRGSGTRVLLDYEMQRLNIKPSDIEGYEDEEYTHMNVAVAVLSGRAGAGLGVRSAANALGLDFIPVGVEEYDLIIPECYWNEPRIQALLESINSKTFKDAVFSMGGYGTDKTGEVIWTFGG